MPDSVTIPMTGSQGRAIYGGLTLALVFNRMIRVVAADRPAGVRLRYWGIALDSSVDQAASSDLQASMMIRAKSSGESS